MNFIWILLSTSLWANTQKNLGTPEFECRDGQRTEYLIWLEPEVRQLKIKKDKSVREFSLTSPNLAYGIQAPGKPLIYNGWDSSQDNFASALDVSTEVMVQYGENSTIRISVVIDNEEKRPLTCQAKNKLLKTAAFEKDFSERYAELIHLAASLRQRDGELRVSAIASIASGIRRFVSTPEFSLEKNRLAFSKQIAASLKKIAPKSMDKIGQKLSGAASTYWQSILEEIQYKYAPETQRYLSWLADGVRPAPLKDMDSVTASLSRFVDSSSYKQVDMKKFFVQEASVLVKTMPESDVRIVQTSLKPEAFEFFKSIWIKASGKKTLADYPALAPLCRQFESAVREKKFKPENIQKALVAFLSSPLSSDPEAVSIYVEEMSIVANELTPRRREDIQGWLTATSRPLYERLIK